MSKSLLALGLLLAVGSAAAQDTTLAPVTVERANGERMIVDCVPPNSAPACARFHELIRLNFSGREIGMLFGPSTGYLEYKTAYDRVHSRYDAFLDDIRDNGIAVGITYHY